MPHIPPSASVYRGIVYSAGQLGLEGRVFLALLAPSGTVR
jgi:hypothetical protein